MDRVTTLQKHGWIGALCNIRVADRTRVVFGQTTHTLMFAALGHTHIAFVAVGVVFPSPHSTNATLIAVVDVLRGIVLPQMAFLTVVAMRPVAHGAFGIHTSRSGRLKTIAKTALHVGDVEAVELRLIIEQ
jgi:hypothetical protein